MGVNKIEFGTDVLIDLTSDTVVPDKLATGYTAHARDGSLIVGTAPVAMDPLVFDYNIGYIDNGTWKYENPTNTYTDIYEVESGRVYFLTLGGNVGSRFRAMTTDTDIRTVSSGNVVGTRVHNVNNPASYAAVTFTSGVDGYLLVAKDNVGKSGVKTYVYDSMASWE